MPIIERISSGGETDFPLPTHVGTVTIKVNGVAATITYQDADNAIISAPTAKNDVVAITYSQSAYGQPATYATDPLTGGVMGLVGPDGGSVVNLDALRRIQNASVSSGTAVSIAGNAISQLFGEFTIPANTIIGNMHARIVVVFAKSGTAGGNFGSVYIGDKLLCQVFPGATQQRYRLEFDIFTNSTASNVILFAQNAQNMFDLGASEWITTEAATSVVVDFSQSQTVYVRGYAQAGEVQTLLGWSMEWSK